MAKRNPKTYSLFGVSRKGRRKHYVRLSALSMPLQSARYHWQDALLAGVAAYVVTELRPVGYVFAQTGVSCGR